MICVNCKKEHATEDMRGKSKCYCPTCYEEISAHRKQRLGSLRYFQSLPLDVKIQRTKLRIRECVQHFGIDAVYVSYSGGKDSTVLSHIIKTEYPDILHIFSNTTCEFPETIAHVKWEKEHNNTNLISITPTIKGGLPFTFLDSVRKYGFPVFSKSISNAIRTYRHAKTERTRANSLDYIQRNFPKFVQYINLPISDKCCEKLKKNPLKKYARENGLECAIIGTLAAESHQRQNDWIRHGCNTFHVKKDNQCRPLSFWTDQDIYDYIKLYSVKIADLYQMGYKRNGCMFCGFGSSFCKKGELNNYQQLAITHPTAHAFVVKHFADILDACDVKY